MSILNNNLVIKLGGTSQTKEGYSNLLEEIRKNNTNKIIVVVSAVKNVTNLAIELIKTKNKSLLENIISSNKKLCDNLNISYDCITDIVKNLNMLFDKECFSNQDAIDIISSGETFTANILNSFLQKNNLTSFYLDSTEVIHSNMNNNNNIYNKGQFEVNNFRLSNLLVNNDVIVVPGFRASTPSKNVCLMGRGGSDTTGSIIAASLKAKKYMIWTDVNGIFSGDPNIVKHVNIIPTISYNAAQEISAMGAKVIHPYCIKPCMEANIPIYIRNTYDLNSKNTVIENCLGGSEKSIYSITNQSKISVFKIKSLNMWNNYGFVYHIFSKFKDFNVDVNIINTSQFDITTTTDDLDENKLYKLKQELEKDYIVELFNNCNCVSLVGENIRKYDKINKIINALKDFDIKLTSYSSNDMSISFVVENDIHKEIINQIHMIAFPFHYFEKKNCWWNKLLQLKPPEKCKYFYSLDIVSEKINILKSLKSINRVYYAMKANNSKEIIYHMIKNNIGLETVSLEEIMLVVNVCKNNNINFNKVNILYTPNFASIEDYIQVYNISDNNINIIVDNIDMIVTYKDFFANKKIGLRLDLDYGFGHCNKVITQGVESKFGMTCNDIIENINIFTENNISINGLHSHMGSGITDFKHWINNFKLIMNVYKNIPFTCNKVEWFDIGGGFGIGDAIDFKSFDRMLSVIKKNYEIEIYIEPGRFLVAEAGVILGKITQIKYKNKTKFIGTNVGMTDIIRPALYSAIHPIYFNDNNKNKELVTVVGPICESGDVLVRNLLVDNNLKIGDPMVVENTGAYGFVMASNYNNRELPEEVLFE